VSIFCVEPRLRSLAADSKSDSLSQGHDGHACSPVDDGTDVLSVNAAGSYDRGMDWHVIV
jgi:hypothetical protein